MEREMERMEPRSAQGERKRTLVVEPLLEIEVAPILRLRRAEGRRDLTGAADHGIAGARDERRVLVDFVVQARLAGVALQVLIVHDRLTAP